jgi:hypothetical protein
MAEFRLRHSSLFPGGTRLLVNRHAGIEKLVLHSGTQVTLEVAGLASPAVTPTLHLSQAHVVSVSPPTGHGTKRTFTIKGIGTGHTILSASNNAGHNITAALHIYVGAVVNHVRPGAVMEHDLVAKVFRGSDPAKMHVLNRMLANDPDNLFNEKSSENQRRWCPSGSCLPCGTVCKAGGQQVFDAGTDYTYEDYYEPIAGMGTPAGRAGLRREDIKYNPITLDRGCKAIQQRLTRGQPVLVGLTYQPVGIVTANGTLNVTGSGGHTVLIVGCNADASKFLYIDPYPQGSKLDYAGGPAGANAFPGECDYMGMFELQADIARGCMVLRQSASSVGHSGVFAGDQYLEVVSGPLSA